MLHPLLEKYIPSRSYVEFLKAHNASFTDFETAAILFRILSWTEAPLEEALAVWRSLLEQTEDSTLKQQLAEEIALDEKALELLRTKTDGSVYIILDSCKSLIGLAGNYETAYANGLNRKVSFQIEKHLPPAEFRKPAPYEIWFNPYRNPKKSSSPSFVPKDHPGPIVSARFHKDGTLFSVQSEMLNNDPGIRPVHYPPSYFTTAAHFITSVAEYPSSFERGDIVRYAVCREEHPEDIYPGIVTTSQTNWIKLLKEFQSGFYSHSGGTTLDVEFLTANGRFWSDQAFPFLLEHYAPEKEQPWCALIEATGKLIRGDGDLEWYTICYEAYQHKLQANKAAKDVATDQELFGL